ncbi:hypothetical protein [Streptomyces sennicomposti]
MDSWTPTAAPHTSTPATATPTVSVKARAGTAADGSGRTTRTWAPNRSYSQPVASAATASAAMADQPSSNSN